MNQTFDVGPSYTPEATPIAELPKMPALYRG